jgi:hypothetical protein
MITANIEKYSNVFDKYSLEELKEYARIVERQITLKSIIPYTQFKVIPDGVKRFIVDCRNCYEKDGAFYSSIENRLYSRLSYHKSRYGYRYHVHTPQYLNNSWVYSVTVWR